MSKAGQRCPVSLLWPFSQWREPARPRRTRGDRHFGRVKHRSAPERRGVLPCPGTPLGREASHPPSGTGTVGAAHRMEPAPTSRRARSWTLSRVPLECPSKPWATCAISRGVAGNRGGSGGSAAPFRPFRAKKPLSKPKTAYFGSRYPLRPRDSTIYCILLRTAFGINPQIPSVSIWGRTRQRASEPTTPKSRLPRVRRGSLVGRATGDRGGTGYRRTAGRMMLHWY